MITDVVQRWFRGRDSYRSAREFVDTSKLEVSVITSDRVARDFVVEQHYSRSFPAARFRYGLHEKGGALVGVAVFSVPSNTLALAPLPGPSAEDVVDGKKKFDPRVELGRFVLLNRIGANAESWFLARCFAELRSSGIIGVVSFSDPFPRTTAAGSVIFAGHVGCAYQASNAVYLGQARPDTVRLLPDGRTLHNRSLAKLRAQDRGWRYVLDELVGYGAEPPANGETVSDWLGTWMPQLVRQSRKPGNHKYVWALDRSLRRMLPASLPYPKFHLQNLRGAA